MSGLGWDAWYTLAVVALMFLGLARNLLGPDVLVFSALVALWVAGVVPGEDAFRGFSNHQVLTVGLLFIVSAAMQETGALQAISRFMLGRKRDGKKVMARLLFPTMGLSAFLNNTPIVAMFTPAVRDWALRNGKAPSKFLIPLSYAAILGGTCTLIGTSTNLVVSGLFVSISKEQGQEVVPLSMFELTPVGLPAALIGLVFLATVGRYLLPDRNAPDMAASKASREYSVLLEVQEGCPLVGKTIEAAGLRHLSGLYVGAVERGSQRLAPARPDEVLRVGDRLQLYGLAETVVELQKIQGLVPVTQDGQVLAGQAQDTRLFEVVISQTSPLVGQTIREAAFRRRYDAAVIAVHRGGARLSQKIGDVELKAGDTLMIEASKGFRRAWGNTGDFYLVAQVDEAEKPKYHLAKLTFFLLVLMVLAMATGWMSSLKAAALAAVAMLFLGAVQVSTARRSVDLSVLIVIASSFGISGALASTGLAAAFADLLMDLFGEGRPILLLAAIYLTTVLCTELLSNNAAAALVVPLAMEAAALAGVDPRPYVVAVAIGASMSFVTPLGYQTNLMVFGPGGYRFVDYVRIGVPMAILCFVVAMVMIPLVWGFG